MKSLVIAIAGNCEFAKEFITLGYDLGHIIYVDGTPDEPVQELMNKLQIPRLDDGMRNSVDLSIASVDTEVFGQGFSLVLSISEAGLQNQFDIFCARQQPAGLNLLEREILDLSHLINGADIYRELMASCTQMLNLVITKIAQGALEVPEISLVEKPQQISFNALRSWHKSNETEVEYPSGQCSLFAAFKEIALAQPQQPALIFEGQTLTYRQLYNLSLQVAEHIKPLVPPGLQRQPIIALALHKSVELYAAILGVLAAGATYVPIDPEYPEDRIANIIKGAQPQVLIKHSDSSVADMQAETVLDISALALNPDQRDQDNNEVISNLSNSAAVIIYTSGSTGLPKGVQLSHSNIIHFCNWYQRHVDLNANSKPLQFTTVSFDASLLDIFPSLLVGACLIVPNKEQRHDFNRLNQLVIEQNVSHAFIPPAMLGALPEYLWPSMQHIVTGGDVCDLSTIARWAPGRSLHNIYGPTECTVLATTELFTLESNNKVIGTPIANTQVYLLNERLEPVTTREHGELYIAGRGVGLGYFNALDMTNERFVNNPFATPNSELMYKTGDTCYWDEQGKINFVGRKDNQLKIRGFRVELGEIENVILGTGLYRQCTVLANDKKQIRAFVSQASGASSIAQLEMEIAKCLPAYMMPSHILELDQFPSTVNGKIDRQKLLAMPLPSQVSVDEESFSDVELSLRQIWAEALGLSENEISKKESFFNLGGHSLLVSKMLLAVKNQFTGGFTLARFMENPTIAGLASLLTDNALQKGDQISERIYSDMVLDSKIRPLALANTYAFAPRAVLLTGANGFLGVHILEELINQTKADIYCVIRASSEEYAYKKLHEAYAKYGVKNLDAHPRVKTVLGDLSQPLLGLSEEVFSQLADEVDAIYHNGAQVNHIYDYDYLYESNVRSTNDLLRLATTKKNKQFIYISTLSAASNRDVEGRFVEDGPADHLPAFVNNGYNLTKWVSEQLVWQAHKRGLPVTLIRPGNICGHSKTGHCYPDQNRILLLLKGSAQLGVAPNWNATFDLCPVDFIARGLVAGTTDAGGHSAVMHFHNPMPLQWSEYVSRLNHHGVPIKLIAPEQWRNLLLDLDEHNALFNVISFYLDETNEDIGDISMIDYHKTLFRLQQFGMSYPQKDHELVDANLDFLIRSKFIERRPQQAGSSASRIK